LITTFVPWCVGDQLEQALGEDVDPAVAGVVGLELAGGDSPVSETLSSVAATGSWFLP
jgi:hypothetical protein